MWHTMVLRSERRSHEIFVYDRSQRANELGSGICCLFQVNAIRFPKKQTNGFLLFCGVCLPFILYGIRGCLCSISGLRFVKSVFADVAAPLIHIDSNWRPRSQTCFFPFLIPGKTCNHPHTLSDRQHFRVPQGGATLSVPIFRTGPPLSPPHHHPGRGKMPCSCALRF